MDEMPTQPESGNWPSPVSKLPPCQRDYCHGDRTVASKGQKRKLTDDTFTYGPKDNGAKMSRLSPEYSLPPPPPPPPCCHEDDPPSNDFPPQRRLPLSEPTKDDITRRTETCLDGTTGGLQNVVKGNGGFNFFTFPAEIRNMIYGHILHYPDCTDLYSVYYNYISSQRDRKSSSQKQVAYSYNLYTPSILLLCRRITNECLPILKSRRFIIDRLPPFRLDSSNSSSSSSSSSSKSSKSSSDDRSGPMRLSDFIGRRTLQTLRYIDFRVGLGEGPLGSGWIWKGVLDELLELLLKCNTLVTLRLLIRLCNPSAHPANWEGETNYLRYMKKKMKHFIYTHPNVFMPCHIIVEEWLIDGQRAIFKAGRIYGPRGKKEDMLEQPDRMYPDREMFPGSIMEFLEPLPPPLNDDEEEED